MNMLRIVKKDLKSPRHKSAVVEDSDEEDPIDIEESESDDEVEESENDENSDDNLEQESKVKTNLDVEKKTGKEPGDSGGSENSDSDFDDDAMFRMDAHLVQMLKKKKIADGSSSGTLFAQIDHCMTGFGKRLLRKWLVRPLRRAESILERQDAIAELKILVLQSSFGKN